MAPKFTTMPVLRVPSFIMDELLPLTKAKLVPHGKTDYSQTGALREGKTFYVRNIKTVSKTEAIAGSTARGDILALLSAWIGLRIVKCYYHELLPGQQIYAHEDSQPYFTYVQRYQIFLDLHPDYWIDHGGERPVLRENFLHLFNAQLVHAYKNNSERPWGFFVMDAMLPEHADRFKED